METNTRTKKKSEKLFDYRSSEAQAAIEARMNDYIQVLKSAKGLFSASDTVTRRDWSEYIHELDISSNYPGMQGIGFAQCIHHDSLQAHISKIQLEGFPNYQVFPQGSRPLYTPIIYLEPFSGRNVKAFGFDMYSDTIRRKAMQMAVDRNLPSMSEKVKLIQETDRNIQAGFLIYIPLYKKKADLKTVQSRRKSVIGFVYCPFRVNDLMKSILARDYPDLNIEIYDGNTISEKNLIFSKNDNSHFSHSPQRYHALTRITTIQVGNHRWKLYFSSLTLFHITNGSNLPNTLLISGIIISLLISTAIWFQTQTRLSDKIKQTITDNATAALFMTDANGYCTFMNPAAEKMTGFTLEEIRQYPLHESIHPIQPNRSANYNGQEPYEDFLKRKDGVVFPARCTQRPIYENGKLVSTIIEARDITQEKENQHAVIESEARFRNMADSAPVMIWITDAAGECIYLNKQWIEFTGQKLEEGLGRGWLRVMHSEDTKSIGETYQQAYSKRTAFNIDYRIIRHDGEYRWMISSAMPRFNQNGDFLGYIGSVIDITERKEAERQMKEYADRLQKVFLEVPAIVGLIRAPDQAYILVNPLLSNLYSNRQLLGKNIQEAHPELEGQGFFEIIDSIFDKGKPFVGHELPIPISREDGSQRTGYYNLVCQPLFDQNKKVELVLIFAVEVTELVTARKTLLSFNAELSLKNEELLRINTDLDNFVYTASHDLKAPIANLEGLNILLKKRLELKLDETEAKMLDMIGISTYKLKNTIRDLTEITKVQKDKPENIEFLSFDDILKDIKEENSTLIAQASAVIYTNFQVKQIQYARKNLRSILYNLISNAIKYGSPERPTKIDVMTQTTTDYIILSVKDNGLGIREEQQHKLFSMFQRFHTHVEGTGIGLYIVKRIIENNGGKIEVESEEGKGTTFHVFFKV
ncbi:MAG: CHASE domain-containing protein [Bacteroidota bacterium]